MYKKKIYVTVLEKFVALNGLMVGLSLSLTAVGASIGVPITRCTSFSSSAVTLITKEFFPKSKQTYTSVIDWRFIITILNEKILNESTNDNKTDGKQKRRGV